MMRSFLLPYSLRRAPAPPMFSRSSPPFRNTPRERIPQRRIGNVRDPLKSSQPAAYFLRKILSKEVAVRKTSSQTVAPPGECSRPTSPPANFVSSVSIVVLNEIATKNTKRHENHRQRMSPTMLRLIPRKNSLCVVDVVLRIHGLHEQIGDERQAEEGGHEVHGRV